MMGPPHADQLADLTEEISGRLLSGEPFDAESYIARHPSCAGPIVDLLPTIHHLADLGRTLAHGRKRRGTGPAHSSFDEGPLS
ncbi:hypothetical protein [Aquisphaera insulae]|uniref:hypothetical protein n=1 Tax=Aquisphaera insulae TaxID=2712864 RepID=UPI0013ECFC12|nr:hypothetical protein [Aquisphaera insulae]